MRGLKTMKSQLSIKGQDMGVRTDETDKSVFYVNGQRLQAAGTKIAVQIYVREEKTKGGIIVPEGTRQRDVLDSPVGRVVAVGKDAYKEGYVEGPYCKPGDWVIYPRYNAARMNWNDEAHVAFLDDVHIIAVVPNPEGIKPAIPLDKF